jgi:hypothetical protein
LIFLNFWFVWSRDEEALIIYSFINNTIDKAIIAHCHIFGIYTYELILALVNNKFVNIVNKVYVKNSMMQKKQQQQTKTGYTTLTSFECILFVLTSLAFQNI